MQLALELQEGSEWPPQPSAVTYASDLKSSISDLNVTANQNSTQAKSEASLKLVWWFNSPPQNGQTPCTSIVAVLPYLTAETWARGSLKEILALFAFSVNVQCVIKFSLAPSLETRGAASLANMLPWGPWGVTVGSHTGHSVWEPAWNVGRIGAPNCRAECGLTHCRPVMGHTVGSSLHIVLAAPLGPNCTWQCRYIPYISCEAQSRLPNRAFHVLYQILRYEIIIAHWVDIFHLTCNKLEWRVDQNVTQTKKQQTLRGSPRQAASHI